MFVITMQVSQVLSCLLILGTVLVQQCNPFPSGDSYKIENQRDSKVIVQPTSTVSNSLNESFSQPTSTTERNDVTGSVQHRHHPQRGEKSKVTTANPFPSLFLKLDREYTPGEIAEYIYSTGNEQGFVQNVFEMVQDGQIMASKDDVIRFLEAVQTILAEMKKENSKSSDIPVNHRVNADQIRPHHQIEATAVSLSSSLIHPNQSKFKVAELTSSANY